MESALDAAMGIMLGVSIFVFVLSFLAYRRSGIRATLLLPEGLALHIAFTVLIIVTAHITDWYAEVDGLPIVVADAILLVAVLSLGFFGGMSRARSP
jgi:hypothetical protein